MNIHTIAATFLLTISGVSRLRQSALQTLFSSAAEGLASTSESDAIALFTAQAMLSHLLAARDPRPKQGGQRISEAMLLAKSDRECLWEFR